MFKKMVALTLAALMLINPMTAMAVSWGEVQQALVTTRQFAEQDGISASVDDEGNVTVVGNDGNIEDFFHSDEFTSYSFSGTIHFGGEKFEIYVKYDENGTSDKVLVEMGSDVAIHADKVDVQAEDGTTLEMGGDAFHVYIGGEQQTIVMVGENVTVTSDVQFQAGENSSMNVTIDGDINNVGTQIQEFDENGAMFDENGDPVLRDATVSMGASENASITVTNNGTLKTEDVHFRVDGEAAVEIENNGEILAQEQVGIYAGEESNGTLEFTNNGDIYVNLDTEDDIYEEDYEDDNHIGGVMIGSWENSSQTTVTNTADGVINGNVSGWLDNTDGAGMTFTNEGAVSGDVGVWGNSGEGSIDLKNDGTIEGYFGTNAHEDISIKTSNSGTVEGEMFADNQSSQDMEVTNSGTTNGLSANNNGGATSTVINSGDVVGGEVRVEAGSGTMDFSNTGDINAERFDAHAYEDGIIKGSNDGNIDVDWGYVGSSENGESSFTNTGDIHTNENFDINAGNWPGDENYPGYNPENSSTTSFTNGGNVVTEGSFSGNLFENGSVTLENTADGTMTAVNEGIHLNNTGNGTGSVSASNAGTVNSEWFNVGTEKGGEASISNSGTVNGSMGAYADGLWDEEGNNIQESNGGKVTISNSGTVTGDMNSNVNGTGSTTIINTGVAGNVYAGATSEGSVSVSNDGTVNNEMWVNVEGGATGSVTNEGDVAVGGVGAYGEGSMTFENNGSYGEMFVDTMDNANMTATNNGEIDIAYTGVDNEAASSFINNGTINDLCAEAYGQGTMEATNNGTIEFKYTGFAYGEGQTTITNSATGVVGDSVQDQDVPDGVWGASYEGGSVIVNNAGAINGEVGGGSNDEGKTTITNSGSADTAWVQPGGSDLEFNNEGTVSGTLSVSIGTQGNDVTSEETIGSLLEQTGLNISGYENVDIYTVNPDGETTARYSVDKDGSVKLEEIIEPDDGDKPNWNWPDWNWPDWPFGDKNENQKPDEPVAEDTSSKFDDPANWTSERHTRKMEEKRRASAIGGVVGSPYHVKQLYLGYMSLNLRLFDGEEQLLFKESLSWAPNTGKAGEKNLTLKVKIEDTSALMMRLDGAVIDKLEQAGIVTINIMDGTGNLFMQYQVQDLKDARAMYGLTAKEYIVVGSAEADVLKIAEDGTISPIEGEEAPAEEVADEATAEATEATEEAAEETPAA